MVSSETHEQIAALDVIYDKFIQDLQSVLREETEDRYARERRMMKLVDDLCLGFDEQIAALVEKIEDRPALLWSVVANRDSPSDEDDQVQLTIDDLSNAFA